VIASHGYAVLRSSPICWVADQVADMPSRRHANSPTQKVNSPTTMVLNSSTTKSNCGILNRESLSHSFRRLTIVVGDLACRRDVQEAPAEPGGGNCHFAPTVLVTPLLIALASLVPPAALHQQQQQQQQQQGDYDIGYC